MKKRTFSKKTIVPSKFCTCRVGFLFLLVCFFGCGEPTKTTSDETAAYWVVSKKGSVGIFRDGRGKQVNKLDQFPTEHFSIRSIRLGKVNDLLSEEMNEISGLKQLRDLNLSRSNMDDNALYHLTNLPQLRNLNLSNTSLTDNGLEPIGKFTKLKNLNLSKTKITGSGLSELSNCKKLTELNLSGTELRPKYLMLMKEFTNLIKLDLSNTNVTQKDTNELKEALKYCEITIASDQKTSKSSKPK